MEEEEDLGNTIKMRESSLNLWSVIKLYNLVANLSFPNHAGVMKTMLDMGNSAMFIATIVGFVVLEYNKGAQFYR